MKLGKHFHLSEFTRSQTAARKGIVNQPGAEDVRALLLLVENVLEPLRMAFGKPVVISSGYRSPKLNRAIGGSRTSQHCRGEAADFEIPGMENIVVARWLQDNVYFDQLILEFYTPGQPHSGWVHCSYREAGNRGEVLTAKRSRWGTQYMQGLVA